MSDSSVPPSAGSQPPAPPASGFFGWVRSLGIIRNDGWIGGVASGVATRIGIDPLIVRGIFILLTLLGFPMILIYALAWALLPDLNGSIHLQNLFRGRIDGAMIAIIIIAVVSFVPVVPFTFGLLALPFGYMSDWGYDGVGGVSGVGGVLIALALIALVVVAIVKASKSRSARINEQQPGSPYAGYTQTGYPEAPAPWTNTAAPQAPAAYANAPAPAAFTDAPAQDAPLTPPAVFAAAPAAQVAAPAARTAAPVAPTDPAAPGYDQWRQQHEQWLGSHDQWRQQQADADRIAREQARAQTIAQAQELSRQAAEQARARRAANPRMSVGFVAAVVGVAIIAAAVVALLTATQGPLVAVTASLLTAGGVGALGMLLAGILRRRSGFVTFLTVATLTIALPLGLAAVPLSEKTTDIGQAFSGRIGTENAGVVFAGGLDVSGTSSEDRGFVQVMGPTYISLHRTSDLGERDTASRGAIEIAKGSGETNIYVSPGTILDLEAVLSEGRVEVIDLTTNASGAPVKGTEKDGVMAYETTVLGAKAVKGSDPVQKVTIAGVDDINIYIEQAPEEDSE